MATLYGGCGRWHRFDSCHGPAALGRSVRWAPRRSACLFGSRAGSGHVESMPGSTDICRAKGQWRGSCSMPLAIIYISRSSGSIGSFAQMNKRVFSLNTGMTISDSRKTVSTARLPLGVSSSMSRAGRSSRSGELLVTWTRVGPSASGLHPMRRHPLPRLASPGPTGGVSPPLQSDTTTSAFGKRRMIALEVMDCSFAVHRLACGCSLCGAEAVPAIGLSDEPGSGVDDLGRSCRNLFWSPYLRPVALP